MIMKWFGWIVWDAAEHGRYFGLETKAETHKPASQASQGYFFNRKLAASEPAKK